MSARAKEHWILAALLTAGAALFATGISWGLPSRAIDRFLFPGREPWSGQTIHDLTGPRPGAATRGADVDATPVTPTAGPSLLNASDEQRARILIRYRLYSFQPDEMITLMSLAEMNPRSGNLDPKLYQYGGFWIYPVGALLFAASRLGLVHLERAPAYYLEHPEQFGRFYVVARGYAAFWGLIGGIAVYWITRRLTRRPQPAPNPAVRDERQAHSPIHRNFDPQPARDPAFAAYAATAAYLALPVVINMAHEAKPHLPGAALMLLAVAAAVRYVETGRARAWIAAGTLCGFSFATVLSALPIFLVLPVMLALRPEPWPRRLRVFFTSGLLGGAVYALTNPYVFINWFTNRTVLESNLRNSLAMYAVGGWADGLRRTATLVAEAASPVIVLLGILVPAIALALKWDGFRQGLAAAPRDPRAAIALLLAAPAAAVLLQFCSLAAGKPSEYGRFLVFPATVLVIIAVASFPLVQPATARRWQVIIALAAAVFGGRYVYAFYRDTQPDNSRWQAARIVAERPETTLVLPAEPAPYNCPPVDLFGRKLVLDPGLSTPGPDELLVFPADHPEQVDLPADTLRLWPAHRSRPLGEAAISWADKAIVIAAPK